MRVTIISTDRPLAFAGLVQASGIALAPFADRTPGAVSAGQDLRPGHLRLVQGAR